MYVVNFFFRYDRGHETKGDIIRPVRIVNGCNGNTRGLYDDQIVKCPKDSKVMQVGTYNYQTKMGWKTVPIIRFVKQQ